MGNVILLILCGMVYQCFGAATKCWTCTDEASFRDCRTNGYLATCGAEATGGCQTIVINDGNNNLQITKSCKDAATCASEATDCTEGFYNAATTCTFCCTVDNCNVAAEGECVDNCQHVIEGNYHSCVGCSQYRACSSSTITDNPCPGGLAWNDKTKNCDWSYNSKTCPDYNNLGEAEPFKCWKCDNQASFEACNQNGNLETCNGGDTGGCQTRITYRDGALESISKKCKQEATCQNEAASTDARCPPSTEVHSASNLDCNFCCTTSKCNYVATDSCTSTCDGLMVTDYQSCIQCDVYISCTANPTDNRPCADGQQGDRLLWDNSIPTCVAASSTCPAGNSASSSVSGPCDDTPCLNQGSCSEAGDTYSCQCAQGYKGDTCDETDECSPNPCANNGACTDGDNTYTCVCTTGYKGTDCDETDECSPNPCANNGACTDGDNSYTCACTTGYKGTDCDVTDECSPDPCDNGATCVDGDATYTCVCPSGYSGNECQTVDPNASVCDNNPCQNGGTCAESMDTYTCSCVGGFSGDNCETDDTPASGCEANPCDNGGTCEGAGASYTCVCATGYTGTDCEDVSDDSQTSDITCGDSPCENEAECTDGDSGYTCTCTADYTGTQCETHVDDLSGANAQSGDDEESSSDSSGQDTLTWVGVGVGVAAALVGASCLIYFLLGRKPKKENEEEKEANGIAPGSTAMPHGGNRQTSFNRVPTQSPVPVETINEVAW